MLLPNPAVLAADAASAARIRALALDPDVIALRVERIRGQVDACAWVAIGLGLAFTAVNVQAFAASDAAAWSPGWLVAWLLDPMVSLLLIAVLRAEQVTARWQVATGRRVTAAKWGCFAATYAMNTWASWTSGAPSGVVLHSVPPLVVLLGAEVAPELRDRLTAAVRVAAHDGRRDDVEPGAGSVCGLDLPGEAASTAVDPGQDRVAALAVPPTVGPRPGPDPELEFEELTPAEAGSLLGITEDAVLGRQREGALPARLLYTELALGSDPTADEPEAEPASAGEPEAAPASADVVQYRRDDVGTDPRVDALVELLAAGEPVTGAQAAALHEVSDRQGRRLLREARARTTTAAPVAGSATTPPRGWLRVVPDDPATATESSSSASAAGTAETTAPTTTSPTTTAATTGGEHR